MLGNTLFKAVFGDWNPVHIITACKSYFNISEISGSFGGKCEDDNLLGYCIVWSHRS
jgi:hypothetical protein